MSQTLNNDIKCLGIDYSKIDTLTVSDARKAYHKMAKQIHPDKNKNPESDAAFQELGHSYERILKFIVDKLKTKTVDKPIQPNNDEEHGTECDRLWKVKF